LERLKSATGPLRGTVSSFMSFLNDVIRSKHLQKYAPLMDLPLASYYYSRISSPSTFFNSHYSDLYSSDFAHLVSKEYSLRATKRYLTDGTPRGLVNEMLYVDTKTALPDDLLLKADKMTMANSVELRVPLLDHALLEFAASLPERFKVRGFTTKYIAKKALRKRVPQEILDRKKVGFPVPYGAWLKTELNDMVHDVLLDRKTLARGYFKRSCVEKLIKEHSTSERYPKEILSLVSLELWHRAFLGTGGATDDSPVLISSSAVGHP
jgi:asparagine synthase (glutamine-hydrolysing)